MNRVGGKIILWGLILGMLAFTAIRTIHFLQLTFPPDQRYVAYLGLVAFDVGVLGWFYYATHSAEGAAQRAVAYGMIFVCCAGVIATTIADMTIVSSENGLAKIPPDVGILGLWAVIIVIVLNFLAGIIVHLVDPNHQKHFEMQNAKDVIHSTTMQHIRQQAHTIAPQIATQVAQYWATQVTAEMTGQLPGIKQMPQLAPPTVNSTAQALPQTGELPAIQQPPQKDGFFTRLAKAARGEPSERTCDACGKGGPGGLDGSVWLCQECLDRTLTSRAAHIAAIRESAQSETKPDTAMDEWFNLYKKSGESGIMSFPAFMKKMRDATNPLPKSPLDSQAGHEGNQNGNK